VICLRSFLIYRNVDKDFTNLMIHDEPPPYTTFTRNVEAIDRQKRSMAHKRIKRVEN
jgi:hypothetical protein